MNPLSLLATGGKKLGGLFAAMGENFDRNAAGALPEILGSDYTPAMKSRARVNAIMGIGQALAGQAPLPQSLAHGQQGILAGWQMGQDLKRQKEQRAALAQLGQEMLDSPNGGNDAEAMFAQAQKYDRIAARHMIGGNEKAAEHYLTASAKLRELAQKRVKQPVGEPITAVGADGKARLLQRHSDGTVTEITGYSPEAKTQVVDLGDRQAVVDMRNPGQYLRKNQTPDSAASVGQRAFEFNAELPLKQRQTAATEMGARASMASAGAAQQNAATSADRLAFDKQNPQSGKLGEDAIKTISDLRVGIQRISRLGDTLANHQSYSGPIRGLSTAPVIGRALTTFGVETPAKLEAEIAGVKQVIGKAMEGGVLRKEDEEKYARILPTLSDPPEVAQHKINLVKEGLSNALATFIQTQQENGRRVGSSPLPAAPSGPRITITPVK